MRSKLQDLPDAELAVLRVLWEQGPATIRQLTDAVYPAGTDVHYATVQKLLERLESKQCVRRDTSARAHIFCAAIDRDELIGRQLQAVAEKLCEGSLTPLLTHLVRAQRLTSQEWQALQELIDQLARQPRPKTRRR